MIICHSRRFIYFHLHKCGGTSIEIALEPLLQWNDLLLGSTPFGEVANDYYWARFRLDKHSSVADVERVCGPEIVRTYSLFATVRHPVARICSLYNYLIDLMNGIQQQFGVTRSELRAGYDEFRWKEPILEWSGMQAVAFSTGFSEFIRDDRLRDDPGFQPQVRRLRAQSGEVHVLCFRIEDQLPNFQRAIWDRTRVSFEVPVANRSVSREASPGDLDAIDIAYLRERFREDYEAFGY